MAYPLSSVVTAGDATQAAHYNNLRLDSLNLGQLAADSVNLATLLERYESRLTLQRLSTDRLRVPASATYPVSIMIAGYMLQTVANVDLAVDQKPSGPAADHYIFANRAAASTTFTLTVSTSITELDDQRLIGRFYWDGAEIVKDSVRTEQSILIKSLLYFVEPQICEGRLTLATNVPVPVADIMSSANVYFTPYHGNRIALYSATYGWRVYPFSELSISIAAVAADIVLDVWIYDDAGTLKLAYTEWSNDTLRAIDLVKQDGVLVKTGAPAYRYLGTVRTTWDGAKSCDRVSKRFLWNCYNRIERQFYIRETMDTWTYAVVDVWRMLNNTTLNRVEFVIGVNESLIKLTAHVAAKHSVAGVIAVGIALDATNTNDANLSRGSALTAALYNDGWYGADYAGYPGIGYHFLCLTEATSLATATFYGDKGVIYGVLSGAIGSIIM